MVNLVLRDQQAWGAVRLCANPVQTGDELEGDRHSFNKQGRTASLLFQALDSRAFREGYSFAPNRINAQTVGAILNKFVPQLAYKHVDDLWFRFINAIIKMVQKCIFAKNSTFSQREKLNDPKSFDA